jgi:hypothetical protein
MRAFARRLGIRFQPVWAFMMPIEKVLAYVNDDPGEATLSPEDRRLIGDLALPLGEAITAATRHRDAPCSLQDAQITLDFQGNVQLCCGLYDARRFTLGRYLEVPLAELQARKYAHDMCGRCMARGVHVYATYGAPEFDDIAGRAIGPAAERLIGLPAERRRKQLRRGLAWVYRTTASRCLSPAGAARLGRAYGELTRLVRRAGVHVRP